MVDLICTVYTSIYQLCFNSVVCPNFLGDGYMQYVDLKLYVIHKNNYILHLLVNADGKHICLVNNWDWVLCNRIRLSLARLLPADYLYMVQSAGIISCSNKSILYLCNTKGKSATSITIIYYVIYTRLEKISVCHDMFCRQECPL